jgi:hypothetical protein
MCIIGGRTCCDAKSTCLCCDPTASLPAGHAAHLYPTPTPVGQTVNADMERRGQELQVQLQGAEERARQDASAIASLREQLRAAEAGLRVR